MNPVPNKITGPNAGGLRQSPIRTPLAAPRRSVLSSGTFANHTMKRIIQFSVLSVLLAASGCATTSYSPARGEVVGGGVLIYWRAPSEGTACLIEKNSDTIIRTESMSKGEVFEFDAADEKTRDQLKVAFPTELKGADFVLHFLPSGKTE